LSSSAPEPRTLIDILYDTARRYPDAPAIDDGTVQLTYSELIADIEDSVDWLGARGIGRGDRIGIRMPSGSYALYVAILSTLAAGAAYVPVDADDPEERAAPGVRRGRCGRGHHRERPGARVGLITRLACRGAADQG
jgi:non-ribosomal peptide synthetase component F